MAKAGSVSPRVLRVLEQIKSGATNVGISTSEGISIRGINDIRQRYGLSQKVGRPRDLNKRRWNKKVPTLPLSDEGVRLVESHLVFARRVAKRVWRLKHAPFDDREEYESCALLALVRAASRFQEDGAASFKTYAARYIQGEISRYRMLAMRGDGWAFKSWKHDGMIRGGQRVGWPTHQETGEQIEIAGDYDESSVAHMARTVGLTQTISTL